MKSDNTLTQAEQADRHIMYQHAVQAPESEVEFFEDTYELLRNKKAMSMKEDFCGTSFLSVEWCKSDPQRTAVGVDICPDTLKWGEEHNIRPAGADVASRIQIIQADVRDVVEPKVDITCAMNFSFSSSRHVTNCGVILQRCVKGSRTMAFL